MSRCLTFLLAGSLAMVSGRAVSANTLFELGFSGPASLSGPTGSVQTASYFCTLTQIDGTSGAQGWQIIMRAQNATITGISLEGTDAEALRRKEPCVFGGFEFPGSFVTNQMGSGLACSAVILSFCGPAITLPAGSTSTIARIDVEAVIPECGGTVTLEYVDSGGCFAGAADTNVVTQNNESHSFANGMLLQEPRQIALVSTDPCDPAALLQALIATVSGLDINPGLKAAFSAILEGALALLQDGNPHNDAGAIANLEAFIQVVSSLPAASISEADAQLLVDAAQQVLDILMGA